MIIAVIEWASDRADDPTVFVGNDADAVRRAVAELLIPLASSGEGIYDIDAEWPAEFPAPDLGDVAAVTKWLADLREATTDAWLTLYSERDSAADTTLCFRSA